MINMFIDATKCIGCKACQVACKNWNSLPVGTEDTFVGTDDGIAEGGTFNTLTDNNKIWTDDKWNGKSVKILDGTGADQIRTISDTTNYTTLTVDPNWDTIPDFTSRYVIYKTNVISTSFTGEYTNPPDYSGSTLTYVKFTEFKRNGKLNFLFFKNQCRHCIRPKCQRACPKGVDRTSDGIILFNEDCTPVNVRAGNGGNLANACPFNVPRYNALLGRYVKCDLCYDRLGKGEKTACELTCPSGAIITGADIDIRALARTRLNAVKNNTGGIITGNRYASLYSGNYGRTNVIYLLAERPRSYGKFPRGN